MSQHPQTENSLQAFLKDCCRTETVKARLLFVVAEEMRREESRAAECAKAALFDHSKQAAACAMYGRAMYLADLVEAVKRM